MSFTLKKNLLTPLLRWHLQEQFPLPSELPGLSVSPGFEGVSGFEGLSGFEGFVGNTGIIGSAPRMCMSAFKRLSLVLFMVIAFHSFVLPLK